MFHGWRVEAPHGPPAEISCHGFGWLGSWHTHFYTVREREVPKNTKQVSLQRILDADKRLWILLFEEVRGKIVAAPSSAPTCDAVILRLSSSSDVLSYLVPQPEFRGPSGRRSGWW